uniref:Small ribosomal subunit protein uS3c n=1 Tax=Euglena anabaena TaxID=38273 RepID=A0A0G3FD71_EUGAN|nr:ribosomal protein S3 [Euglenaria anabaena]AKJ83362.1 ribosomal protein S3 [Euglenaria anabaena]
MGQKVHPIGFRIGVSKEHSSIWFAKSKSYFSFVQEDIFIRNYFFNKLLEAGIAKVEIKRKLGFLSINVYVTKPSLVVGTNGNQLNNLRKELSEKISLHFTSSNITINVIEILNPDSNSRVLAEFIRQQLEKRVPFRRIIKAAITRAQKAGVKGVKIQISGRLNGAEIARTEWFREGQVPLHTLKANIDYCSYKAQTLYGILGIKVWIYCV